MECVVKQSQFLILSCLPQVWWLFTFFWDMEQINQLLYSVCLRQKQRMLSLLVDNINSFLISCTVCEQKLCFKIQRVDNHDSFVGFYVYILHSLFLFEAPYHNAYQKSCFLVLKSIGLLCEDKSIKSQSKSIFML